jgi:hypothetical protein
MRLLPSFCLAPCLDDMHLGKEEDNENFWNSMQAFLSFGGDTPYPPRDCLGAGAEAVSRGRQRRRRVRLPRERPVLLAEHPPS